MTNSLKKLSEIRVVTFAFVLLSLSFSGCQSVNHWWNNGLRVGPNYSQPQAQVAAEYSMANTERIDGSNVIDPQWWQVFNDPDLNVLIDSLRQENLTLKAACYRIKEARHQRNIAAANLFPQSQQLTGSYSHTQSSTITESFVPGFSPVSLDNWSLGFDVGWEIDLWGRIRRSVEAADANLESVVQDRNFAIVSLTAETASLYINIRAFDERIELAKKNATLQEGSLKIARARFKEGRTSKLDVVQAESNLASTRSLIPQLELARRQSLNAIAVLLGMPPSEVPVLSDQPKKIPEIPSFAVVGIPADLMRRRPDIRSAERSMKAQFEQIGIAEADLYPTFSFSGSLGWDSAKLSDLVQSGGFAGSIAPAFGWNILNYGRLREAICVEEARFKQIQMDFENTVLSAQREVEDGIVEFVKRNEQYEYDLATQQANKESVELAIASFKEGKTDFGRVFVVQTSLVTAQDQVVATRASIALALIETYRALGGGWEVYDAMATDLMVAEESVVPGSEVIVDATPVEQVIVPVNAESLQP
ncbi:efflux transporter outer membrane subunit [Mariniblastus fucicola]|uniref:Outer membrane protein OprM n=1 Tax=Mariniblastus fucicola TaxID=980251 RepID=A0A5B9PCN5_9BACT|nr:efflux transporter outer membrane subunit [Mariniblastus fucicola]QEG22672.1 Outer membrane protein OprM precursor [Mariniblastus fucicola]